LFERPQLGSRSILVHLEIGAPTERGADDAARTEFVDLARSAGAQILDLIRGSRVSPDPKYFAGSGKAQEIAEAVSAQEADLVVFNHELSPSQERNLERLFKCRVLDRTGLILDIFAQRARSHEGKLQVELAQLQHLSTRLVRGWSHLERQKGGIGLRGPGETQLETDRRLLAVRIKSLKRKLEKVRAQREQGRQARRKAEVPLVALVGYTNAGKSTLFNALTGASAYAEDQLFATLDTTIRRYDLGIGEPVVLADTVGFVRDLPHDLVAAFNATLEETRQAHLLLHVIDASDPERLERIRQVQTVLEDVGADQVPQIEVINKIDACEGMQPRVERDPQGRVLRVYVSALEGKGLELLRSALADTLYPDWVEREIRLAPGAGRLRAELFQLGAVKAERNDDDGSHIMRVALPRSRLDRLMATEGEITLI